MRLRPLLPVAAALLLTACAGSGNVALTDAEDLLLRGSFNGWQAQPAYQLQQQGDGHYSVTVTLAAEAKPQFFKLGDSEWQPGANCGPLDIDKDQRLVVGQSVAVDCNQPRRSFSFLPPQNGDYRFVFTTSDDKLLLRIEQL